MQDKSAHITYQGWEDENENTSNKRGTHLLNTSRQKRTIARENLLQHHAPSVAAPRALHLGKHPLVRPHPSRLVEVDGVVQADHHAQVRPRLPVFDPARLGIALKLVEPLDLLPKLGRQVIKLLGLEGEPPQPVDPPNGADEVAVRHVRQRVQVRLVPAAHRDAAPRAHPVARLHLVKPLALVLGPDDRDPVRLEGRVRAPLGLALPVIRGRPHAVGKRRRVPNLLLAAAALLDE